MDPTKSELKIVLTKCNLITPSTHSSNSVIENGFIKYKKNWFCNRPLSPAYETHDLNNDKKIVVLQDITLTIPKCNDLENKKNKNNEETEEDESNDEIISSTDFYDSDKDPEFRPDKSDDEDRLGYLKRLNLSPPLSPEMQPVADCDENTLLEFPLTANIDGTLRKSNGKNEKEADKENRMKSHKTTTNNFHVGRKYGIYDDDSKEKDNLIEFASNANIHRTVTKNNFKKGKRAGKKTVNQNHNTVTNEFDDSREYDISNDAVETIAKKGDKNTAENTRKKGCQEKKAKNTTKTAEGTKKRERQKDFCFYCETTVLNFARHIQRHHSREVEVEQIFSKVTGGKERKKLISVLRKKGNFIINSGGCTRPVKKTELSTNFLPCTYCLGYYSSKQLWRHRKKCSRRPKDDQIGKSAQVDAHNLLAKHLRVDQRLREEVFPRMRADEISLVAKRDSLICAFGARYMKIHREKHFINVTSRKMRELSRILIEIKKMNTSIKTLFHALQPQHFDLIVEATKVAARFNSQKEFYESPTFAMNIGTSLKQCCDIAILYALKKKEIYYDVKTAEAEADLKTMVRLLEANWKFDISSQAADDLNVKKWNKVTIIPLAKDLILFKEFLLKVANEAAAKLDSDNHNQSAYINLVESVFCRVLLLNRRRPGELQRLPLQIYENADQNQNYEEFSQAISESEKILMQRFKRVVIRGKRGRGVPVLFSLDVQEHVKILLKFRPNFIEQENPFFFSIPGLKTPIYGYKVMKKNAKACGANNPIALTATRLRKHLATLTQIFNMTEGDIEQLASFMGHTTAIHRKSYRLPDDVYQTAKISKLLLLMEKGAAGEFKGKALEDIDVDLNDDLMAETEAPNNDDDSVDFEDNDPDDLMTFDQDNSFPKPSTSTDGDSKLSTQVKAKIGKKRTLIPWTTVQKKLVLSYFKFHIKNKIPPKKNECETLINKAPEIFHNKDWLKMKVFVQNQYTKKK